MSFTFGLVALPAKWLSFKESDYEMLGGCAGSEPFRSIDGTGPPWTVWALIESSPLHSSGMNRQVHGEQGLVLVGRSLRTAALHVAAVDRPQVWPRLRSSDRLVG